jgi:curved DNA-binding protein CbpA
MSKIHSHYENLKVTRDAPPEVIRAAYRSLSQKFHPDLNAGDANSEAVMKLINKAYSVLSDPDGRKAHDAWIAALEGRCDNESEGRTSTKTSARGTAFEVNEPRPVPQKARTIGIFSWPARHIARNWVQYVLISALCLAVIISDKSKSARSNLAPDVSPSNEQVVAWPVQNVNNQGEPNSFGQLPKVPKLNSSAYVRPLAAPNGAEWPLSAGYIDGYMIMNEGGRSTARVDNSQGDSDVFVKVFSLDGPKAYPARQFFVPAHSQFTVEDMVAGNYDVRYQDLSSGLRFRSESFVLHEIIEEDGVRFSNVSMTLYKVRDGKMQTYPLDEDAF